MRNALNIFISVAVYSLTLYCLMLLFKADFSTDLRLYFEGKEVTIAFYVLVCIIFFAIVLGCLEKTVIYRNYNDLALCFLCGLIPFIFFYASSALGLDPIITKYAVSILIALAIGTILFRTVEDGVGPFLLPFVAITKICLGLLFVLLLIQLLNPSGKNRSDRRGNRTFALIVMLVLAPVLNKLVVNPDGILSPPDLMKGRRFSGASSLRNSFD